MLAAPTSTGVSRFAFPQVSAEALAFLQVQLGLDLWLVNVRAGREMHVAAVRGSGLELGAVVAWEETVCARLARGQGPPVAPRCREVPAYAAAPVRRWVPFEAYLGVLLRDGAGRVVGSLCGLAFAEQPDDRLAQALPLVEQFGQLLSAVLAQQGAAERWSAAADQADLRAERDVLTELANRRGWERALLVEEGRSDRSAAPTGVLVVDLDGFKRVNDVLGHLAGDALLRTAGRELAAACRPQDVVARVGGDEFAVLAGGCDARQLQALRRRIEQRFADSGVRASVGSAAGEIGKPLRAVWERADAAMYAAKARRQLLRSWDLPAPPDEPEPPADPPLPPGSIEVSPEQDSGGCLAARRTLLLALHLVGGLEPREIVRLQMSDVVEHPSGLLINVAADSGGRSPSRRLSFRRQQGDHCPVRAFRTWREAFDRSVRDQRRALRPADPAGQPLFCPVGPGKRLTRTRLSEQAVRRILSGTAPITGLTCQPAYPASAGHDVTIPAPLATVRNG